MKYTNLKAIDFYGIEADEARNLPPVSNGDGAVIVHCQGEVEHWKSRAVCAEFYKAGSVSCCGSEAERYMEIYLGCRNGEEVPTDGLPIRKPKNDKPLTEAEKQELAALRARKEIVGDELCDVAEKNRNRTDGVDFDKRQFVLADEWNDLALKIIALERRARQSVGKVANAA